MRQEKSQRHFPITLVLPNGKHKAVDVKASNRETAERRALKRNPAAIAVYYKS